MGAGRRCRSQVRAGRLGERFQPLGMDGHAQKLSDFWVNVGLPRQARKGWPLVVSAGRSGLGAGLPPGRAFPRDEGRPCDVIHLSLNHNPA